MVNDITPHANWNHLVTNFTNVQERPENNHKCNINSKGKMFRLIAGALLIFVTLMLVMLVVTSLLAGSVGWWLAGVTFLSGILLVYEGWSGWCVLRAIGIPTPV